MHGNPVPLDSDRTSMAAGDAGVVHVSLECELDHVESLGIVRSVMLVGPCRSTNWIVERKNLVSFEPISHYAWAD